jgi:hypothetical protein
MEICTMVEIEFSAESNSFTTEKAATKSVRVWRTVPGCVYQGGFGRLDQRKEKPDRGCRTGAEIRSDRANTARFSRDTG